MKKLFDIPIYGLSPLKLDDHVSRFVAKLKSQLLHLEEDTFSCIKDIETFPMRSWNYNHIVGYIRVEMSDTDMLFDVFYQYPFLKDTTGVQNGKFVYRISVQTEHIFILEHLKQMRRFVQQW